MLVTYGIATSLQQYLAATITAKEQFELAAASAADAHAQDL